MSNDQQGVIHAASEGGISGTHPATDPFQFLVAPSTSNEFNTARLRLIPIACWKIEDIRFAFDSSFVTPEIKTELKELAALRERHKQADLVTRSIQYPPLSIFGHADPSFEGNFEPGTATEIPGDHYNKALSGRRATVIYALLVSHMEPGKAVSLWSSVAHYENWGMNQRQTMQALTGLPGGATDAQLFRAYMQKLCPKELSLTPKDFLAQGADAAGKGDYQVCGRFNPLLLFSDEKEQRFKTAFQQHDQQGLEERDSGNAPNRRVMVLLFRPGSKIDPAKWPCPRATEDIAGCKKRFWSNGEKRRGTPLPNDDRKFEDTHDTFACRFYDRLLRGSPCGRVVLRCPWCAFLSHIPPFEQTAVVD
jgi:hypothetical protein